MDINELKAKKKELKVTTDEIAYLAEVPYSTVSKIFTGETKKPQYVTIEKIDMALKKIECKRRIEAYAKAIDEYVKAHPNEDFNQQKFEKKYREEHNLSNAPIPYAVPLSKELINGNLAIYSIRRLTADEFIMLNTDRETELIDGIIFYASAPSLEHQIIAEGMCDLIKQYIRDNNGNCRAFCSGINVLLDDADDTLVVPDIVVRCNGGEYTEYGITGAPDWIIEITSPSTRSVDYHEKLAKYMKYGVKEYWIVDLQKRIVITYVNDMPTSTTIYQFEDEVPVLIYDGRLTVRVSNLLQ